MGVVFSNVEFSLIIGRDEGEPSEYIQRYDGKIMGYVERSGREVRIGEMSVYVIEADRATSDRVSLADVADCLDGDSEAFHAALFDGQEIRAKVESLIREDRLWSPNLLLIQRVELESKFRGRGLAHKAAALVIKTLGASCSIVAVQPFPLEYVGYRGDDWKERRGVPGFEAERLRAWRKVRSFWKSVGFVRVPGTEHYVWPE